jgi:hypothetical protein
MLLNFSSVAVVPRRLRTLDCNGVEKVCLEDGAYYKFGKIERAHVKINLTAGTQELRSWFTVTSVLGLCRSWMVFAAHYFLAGRLDRG